MAAAWPAPAASQSIPLLTSFLPAMDCRVIFFFNDLSSLHEQRDSSSSWPCGPEVGHFFGMLYAHCQ